MRDNGQPPLTDTATASFTINAPLPGNQPPIAANDHLPDVPFNTTTVIIPKAQLIANDRPGPDSEATQMIAVTAVGEADLGTVRIDGDNIVFSPTANTSGLASFVYTITDNGMTEGRPDPKTATATVSFTVTAPLPPNQAARRSNDQLPEVPFNSSSVIIPVSQVIFNDKPGPEGEGSQTLSVTGVGNAQRGTVTLVGNNIVFTPTPGVSGRASFTYTVTDNGTTNGQPDPKSATATVSFTIAAAPTMVVPPPITVVQPPPVDDTPPETPPAPAVVTAPKTVIIAEHGVHLHRQESPRHHCADAGERPRPGLPESGQGEPADPGHGRPHGQRQQDRQTDADRQPRPSIAASRASSSCR